MTLHGEVGHVRLLYGGRAYDAARVEGFTLTRLRRGRYVLAGRLVHADAFKLKVQPHVFVMGKQIWFWPVEHLAIDGQSLRATLGQPYQGGTDGDSAGRPSGDRAPATVGR